MESRDGRMLARKNFLPPTISFFFFGQPRSLGFLLAFELDLSFPARGFVQFSTFGRRKLTCQQSIEQHVNVVIVYSSSCRATLNILVIVRQASSARNGRTRNGTKGRSSREHGWSAAGSQGWPKGSNVFVDYDSRRRRHRYVVCCGARIESGPAASAHDGRARDDTVRERWSRRTRLARENERAGGRRMISISFRILMLR